jgi:hypothetical protein
MTPAGYHDLLSDLEHPGCPVCRSVARHAARYLEELLWESVNDPYMRPRLREAHGFCREHALLAVQIAGRHDGGQGIAILYRDFLGHLREDERRPPEDGPGFSADVITSAAHAWSPI